MASRGIDGTGAGASVGNGGSGGHAAGDKVWVIYGIFDDFEAFANDGEQSEFVEGGGVYGDGLDYPDDVTFYPDHIVQVSLIATCKTINANYAVGETFEIPLTKANNNKQLGTGADSFYYFTKPAGNGTVHVRYAGGGGATDLHEKAVMNGGTDAHANSGKRVTFDPTKWNYHIYIEGIFV